MSQTPDSQQDPDQPQGISLGELTEAFAQAMGGKPQPPPEPVEVNGEARTTSDEDEEAPAGHPSSVISTPSEPEADAETDDPCELSPLTILEAMLFVGNRESQPLPASRAAELMRDVEPAEIVNLVTELNSRYDADGCPYQIVHQRSGYRLTLRKAFEPLRNRFYGRIRQARLSQAAIDVLAIVAYQQPLTAEQITSLRGKPSGHMLSQLVRRQLLCIQRPDDRPRTARYSTTDRFLKLFGMKGLEDLPQSEELQQD